MQSEESGASVLGKAAGLKIVDRDKGSRARRGHWIPAGTTEIPAARYSREYRIFEGQRPARQAVEAPREKHRGASTFLPPLCLCSFLCMRALPPRRLHAASSPPPRRLLADDATAITSPAPPRSSSSAPTRTRARDDDANITAAKNFRMQLLLLLLLLLLPRRAKSSARGWRRFRNASNERLSPSLIHSLTHSLSLSLSLRSALFYVCLTKAPIEDEERASVGCYIECARCEIFINSFIRFYFWSWGSSAEWHRVIMPRRLSRRKKVVKRNSPFLNCFAAHSTPTSTSRLFRIYARRYERKEYEIEIPG
jgi:hypothetical protein